MLWYGEKVECPYCSHTKSRVTDKRVSPQGIRRRRECLKCSKRFTTYEVVDKSPLWVVKKDGTREQFSVEKLNRGISRAFEKRPVSSDKVSRVAQEIEEHFRRTGKKEMTSKKLGEMAMKKIKRLDHVAYIRFASVYRDFQDISDFKKQMEDLQ